MGVPAELAAVGAKAGDSMNCPHAAADASGQDTVQSTPWLVESLAVLATREMSVGEDAVEFPTGRVLGANGINCTKGTGTTVSVTEPEDKGGIDWEAIDVAVIVTEGVDVAHWIGWRVYVTLAPLVEWFWLNVPQGVTPGGHPLADQTTPAEPMSLVTVALKVAGTPPVIGPDGGFTVTLIGWYTVMAVDADPVGSLAAAAIDVAVTTTGMDASPAGTGPAGL
jgi:hypothetical protein